jgi:hypothetical protein
MMYDVPVKNADYLSFWGVTMIVRRTGAWITFLNPVLVKAISCKTNN